MKKLLTATALAAMVATTAQAEVTGTFQKVYEVPNMTASEIKEAFGPTMIDVGQDGMSKFQGVMNTAQGTGWLNSLAGGQKTNIRCDIAVSSFLPSVNEWVEGDVVLQTKDGRARVTVELKDLHGPGKKTCISSIEKHLDTRFASLKKLDNNW
jgi:uncharacterized GH25 family protein